MSSPFADTELAEFVQRLNDDRAGEFDVAAMRAGAARSRTRPAGPELDRVHELELDRPPRALGLLSGAVVLAGDSAGGTPATLACLRLRASWADRRPRS